MLASLKTFREIHGKAYGRFLWLSIAVSSASITISVKLLKNSSTVHLGMLRSYFCLISAFLIYHLSYKQKDPFFQIFPKDNPLAIATCLLIMTIGSIGYILVFICGDFLSLSSNGVFLATNSIHCTILGYFMLGRTINSLQIIFVIGSILSVILISKPQIYGIIPENNDLKLKENRDTIIGYFLGFSLGFLVGLKRIYTIRGRNEITNLHQLVYFSIGSIFSCGCLMSYNQEQYYSFDLKEDWLPLIGVSLSGLFLQFFVVEAVKYESSPTIGSLIAGQALPICILFDYFIMGNKMAFYKLAGCVLTFLCCTLVIVCQDQIKTQEDVNGAVDKKETRKLDEKIV